MKFDVHNYNDIINIKKPKSNHIPMDKLQRAAQFAPYAALTGYDDTIFETARVVNKKKELSEDKKSELSFKLTYLQEHINDHIEIEIIYFVPDKKKKGGRYLEKKGQLKNIDNIERKIEFRDKELININDIYEIKSECFTRLEYNL